MTLLEAVLCWLNHPRLIVIEVVAGGRDFYPLGAARTLVCSYCRKAHT